MFSVIFRNVAFNWIGFSIQAVTTFVLTPIVIRSLGESQYGLWAAITGLTGYYGIVDLGLRGGTTQFLTRYLAQRDYVRLNQSFNSSLAALACIALAVILLSVFLGWIVPTSLALPDGISANTAMLCIVTIGLGVASQFVLFPYSALFVATQRYDLSNAIGISMRILSAIATYWALQRGHGLLALSLVNGISNFAEYGIRCFVGNRLVPQVRISIADIDRERIREFLSYGLWNSVGSLTHALRDGTDLIMIAFFYGELGAAVSRYKLASQLTKYLTDLMGSMTMVFFPTATALHARGDRDGLLSLWLNGTRAILLALASFAIIGWQWAPDFYRLWLGESLSDTSLPGVSAIFRVLLLITVAAFMGGVGRQVLLGCKLVRISSLLTLLESICVLAISFALGYYYRIWGVAIGTLISVVAVRVVLEPIVVARQLKVSLWRYWTQSATRPAMVAIALYGATTMLRDSMPSAANFWQLLLYGGIAAAIALLLIGFVGIDSRERELVLRGLYRRLRPLQPEAR
ncbi:MAG: hypothetical protein O2931_00415 [Planctomycetota bacterium]|nr:hypothetical protein [Planctomycetota bacterium]MDA1177237.1 hypothetical protein [Planctomycetota bacterium]